MEAILRIRNYKDIPNSSFEKAMEAFLEEYPDGEAKKGKRRMAGYASSAKPYTEPKRRQGLVIHSSSEEEEEEEVARPVTLVRPGENLSQIDDSSSDSSSDDE